MEIKPVIKNKVAYPVLVTAAAAVAVVALDSCQSQQQPDPQQQLVPQFAMGQILGGGRGTVAAAYMAALAQQPEATPSAENKDQKSSTKPTTAGKKEQY